MLKHFFFRFQKQPYILKKPLLLGYNKQGEGHVETSCLGQIVVSVIFRPVLSVAKSGKLSDTELLLPLLR